MEKRCKKTSEPPSYPACDHTYLLPHQKINPRFCLTPESMGVELPTTTPKSSSKNTQTSAKAVRMEGFQTLYQRKDVKMDFHKTKRRNTKYVNLGNFSNSDNSNTSKTSEKSEPEVDENKQSQSIIESTDNTSTTKQIPSEQMSLIKESSSSSRLSSIQTAVDSCHGCPFSDTKFKDITDDSTEDSSGAHCEQLMEVSSQFEKVDSDTIRINAKLNEIFVKRLEEIESKNCENPEIKLLTYKEWVDMLLKINECILRNTEELETQVAARLEMVQQNKQPMDCCQSHNGELLKYRNDINTLTKLIQNAYRNNVWDLGGLHFETISREQIFGGVVETPHSIRAEGVETQTKMSSDADVEQKNKMLKIYAKGMKALASEVADRHDEIQLLKKQLADIETEMEISRQKIQIKESVIYRLRQEVEFAYACAISDINSNTIEDNCNCNDNTNSNTTTTETTTTTNMDMDVDVDDANNKAKGNSIENPNANENENENENGNTKVSKSDVLNFLYQNLKYLTYQNLNMK